MKKRLFASIIFMIICIISTFIYAIDAKVVINSSKTSVNPGEEIIFTIRIKDIISEKGATGIEGKISYDTEIFEELNPENVTQAGALGVAYNKENGKVIAEGMSFVKNDSDLIKIKLKVKNDSNLVGKTATISLTEGIVYDVDVKNLDTVSASVKIGEDSSSTTPTPTTEPTAKPDGGSESTPTPSTKPNVTSTPTATAKPNSGENKNDVPITNIDTNTSSGNTSNTTNKNNTSNTTNKGTTSSSSTLPKAGIGSTIAVLTVIAAIIGTVAYIKLRKYSEI